MCFEVWRDGTPNTAAHRCERENGSLQSQFDAGMPCGDRRHPLADRQLHRERQVSFIGHHFFKNKPGVRRKPEPTFGRLANAQSRTHRTHQEGIGSQATGEIKNHGCCRGFRAGFAKAFRPYLTRNTNVDNFHLKPLDGRGGDVRQTVRQQGNQEGRLFRAKSFHVKFFTGTMKCMAKLGRHLLVLRCKVLYCPIILPPAVSTSII